MMPEHPFNKRKTRSSFQIQIQDSSLNSTQKLSLLQFQARTAKGPHLLLIQPCTKSVKPRQLHQSCPHILFTSLSLDVALTQMRLNHVKQKKNDIGCEKGRERAEDQSHFLPPFSVRSCLCQHITLANEGSIQDEVQLLLSLHLQPDQFSNTASLLTLITCPSQQKYTKDNGEFRLWAG